jgi:hypothetical protein
VIEVVHERGDKGGEELRLAKPLDLAELGEEEVRRDRDVRTVDRVVIQAATVRLAVRRLGCRQEAADLGRSRRYVSASAKRARAHVRAKRARGGREVGGCSASHRREVELEVRDEAVPVHEGLANHEERVAV